MFGLTPIRKVIQRVAIFIFILFLALGGLAIYTQNQESITHYKPYYALAYYYIAKHHILNIKNPQPVVAESGTAGSIPILAYHGVMLKSDGVSTSLADFQDQMYTMAQNGWHTVSFNDYYLYSQGLKTLPPKSFLLTFDDNRKDSYYPVDPILQDLNFTAVQYVITGTLATKSNNFHLNKEEINRMIRSGRWDIEAHAYRGEGFNDIIVNAQGKKGHFYIDRMWLPDKKRMETDQEFRLRIRADLAQAKADLKNFFDVEALGFAFPYNDYGQGTGVDPAMRQILLDETAKAYPMLFYQVDTNKGYSFVVAGSNQQMVKRIDVASKWTGSDLMNVLTRGQDKPLPLTITKFDPSQAWIKNTGSLHYDFGTLVLQSNEESRGSLTFLDGTQGYGDFAEHLNFGWEKGSTFTLIFRQDKIQNYYYVTIFSGGLKIGRYINGQQFLLEDVKTNFTNLHARHDLNFSVKGNVLNLNIDGNQLLLNHPVNIQTPKGGLGFEVWDESFDNAYVKIRAFSVGKI